MSVGAHVSWHACGSQRVVCRDWLVLSFHCGGSRIKLRMFGLAASAFTCRVSSPAPSNIVLKSCFPHVKTVRRERSPLGGYRMPRTSELPKHACSSTAMQPMWQSSVMNRHSPWRCACLCQERGCAVPMALCECWSFSLKSVTFALPGTHTFVFWGASSSREKPHVL